MIILLHTSKTMRPAATSASAESKPELLTAAQELATYLKTLTPAQIEKSMRVSAKLANTTHDLIGQWTSAPSKQRSAIDSFLGDIYSGLQVQTWSEQDRTYANNTLFIVSGLYGLLRPLGGIYPYRLELGYNLPAALYKNLYAFWGSKVADLLPSDPLIMNLAALEYSQLVTPFIDTSRVITPSFLTIIPKTGEPTFVVVHAKIARGAFAGWLIKQRITTADQLPHFAELGYEYSPARSTANTPVYICQEFKGLGLSVRLT